MSDETTISETVPPIDWEQKYKMLEAQSSNLEAERKYLNEQVSELSMTLEIANDRWVDQVNENTRLMIQIKKLSRP